MDSTIGGSIMGMTVAYLQYTNLEREVNKSDFINFAKEKNLGFVYFTEEIYSEKPDWKNRTIGNILAELEKDDILLVSDFYCLGKTIIEIMKIIAYITEKNIKIYSVKRDWSMDGSLESQMITSVFKLITEIEKDRIFYKTLEAVRKRNPDTAPETITVKKPKRILFFN